jgi:hypothetical protein
VRTSSSKASQSSYYQRSETHQQPPDNRFRLFSIAAAEEVIVIEHIFNLVKASMLTSRTLDF